MHTENVPDPEVSEAMGMSECCSCCGKVSVVPGPRNASRQNSTFSCTTQRKGQAVHWSTHTHTHTHTHRRTHTHTHTHTRTLMCLISFSLFALLHVLSCLL